MSIVQETGAGFKKQCEYGVAHMGVCKLHGLRHAFAQRRYHELTKQFEPLKRGLLCPLMGGKNLNELTDQEKYLDRRAREIITRSLGHSRRNIVKIYIG